MNQPAENFPPSSEFSDRLAIARQVRLGRRNDITHRLEELSLQIPPATDLDSPTDFVNISYTEKEVASLLKGTQAIRDLYGAELEKLSPAEKRHAMLTSLVMAMKRLLPERRVRQHITSAQIPAQIANQLRELFGVPVEEKETETTAPAIPVPPPKPIWTHQEEQNVLIHVAHLMRKQNLHLIPTTDDRFTNIMFQDMLRDGARNALPRHRLIDLSLARATFTDLNLMFRLEQLLKLRELPKLPPKGLEIDEIMAQKAAATNGTANGHAPEAIPLVVLGNKVVEEPKPEPKVEVHTLDTASDAEILQAGFSRMLAILGRMEKMERDLAEMKGKVEEATGYAEELIKENASLRDRIGKEEMARAELAERVKDMSTKPSERLPRVAILGCRKDEFDEIVNRAVQVGINVEFRHIEQQQAKIYDVHADWAIMMPGLSHAQNDHVTRTVPRVNTSSFPASR